MATIYPIATPIAGGYIVTWYGCASGDTAVAFPDPTVFGGQYTEVSALSDRCFQVFGGTTGTVFIEGSNFIATALNAYATLHLTDDTSAATLTTAGMRQVLEASYYTRPVFTNASSGTHVAIKYTSGSSRL